MRLRACTFQYRFIVLDPMSLVRLLALLCCGWASGPTISYMCHMPGSCSLLLSTGTLCPRDAGSMVVAADEKRRLATRHVNQDGCVEHGLVTVTVMNCAAADPGCVFIRACKSKARVRKQRRRMSKAQHCGQSRAASTSTDSCSEP
jgi:hypothetical protein